jgi:hypothetical protein
MKFVGLFVVSNFTHTLANIETHTYMYFCIFISIGSIINTAFMGETSYFTSTKVSAADKCFTQHHLKSPAGATTLDQRKDGRRNPLYQ